MTPEESACYGAPVNNRKDCKTTSTHRFCPVCDKWKLHTKFPPRKDVSVGISGICRKCVGKTQARKLRNATKKKKAKIEANHGTLVDGSHTTTDIKKKCKACSTWLPLSQFHKDKGTKSGLSGACNTCRLDRNLRYHYGITLEDYDKIYENQRGRCAICNTPKDKRESRLYVDHNHKTGKVRALLCSKCNFLIGNADEKVEVLASAINYLEKHNEDI